MTEIDFLSVSKSPDPLEEDVGVTVTYVVQNNEAYPIYRLDYWFIEDLKNLPTGYATDSSWPKWWDENCNNVLTYTGAIAKDATTAISHTIPASKSVRYLTLVTAVLFDGSDPVSTTYRIDIDRFHDQGGAVINPDQKKGNCFIGGYDFLGARNDILYVKADDTDKVNKDITYNFPFVINQTAHEKIEPDFYKIHYDSSSYTEGVVTTPYPANPSLELTDPAKIAAKSGYIPFIGGSNLELSYYRNPSNTRKVDDTVQDILDKIPQIQSTTGSIYAFTMPLGLTRGMNKYYSNIMQDLSGLVNAEYWQSTTRPARTGATSLVPYINFKPIQYSSTIAQTFNADNTTSPDGTYYVIDSDLHRSVETSDKFYNVVEVTGGIDDKGMVCYHKCRDKYSVGLYGTTPISVTDNNITSYIEVVNYANDLLSKGSRGRVKGSLKVSGNWKSLHSRMITFNDTRNGWVNEDVMVRSTRYSLANHWTELSINNEYLDPNTVLDSFFFNIKKHETFSSPATNEEVKYISAFDSTTSKILNGVTYYMGLITGTTVKTELSGEGYERKPVVFTGVSKLSYEYSHMRAVWQQWDGRTLDTAPITYVALYGNISGGSPSFGYVPIDGAIQYKWRSTQLYVSLCASST